MKLTDKKKDAARKMALHARIDILNHKKMKGRESLNSVGKNEGETMYLGKNENNRA